MVQYVGYINIILKGLREDWEFDCIKNVANFYQ